MCQLYCVTSHDPAKRDDIINKVWEQMSVTQKDGYGAAWFGVDGQIGHHKRRYPRLVEKTDVPPFVQPKAKPTDNFGDSNDIPSDGGFLIIHGRGASPQVPIALANTHPFLMTEMEDGRRAALAHNGLVKSFTYDHKLPGCTCDSELLMQAYVDGGIDGVEENIDGRYAFMYLQYEPPTEEEIANSPDGVIPIGKKTLHVAKDSTAVLYAGTLKDNTFVIATTEILLVRMEAESAGELKNHVLLVFDGKESYQMTEFKSIAMYQKNGYQQWWDKKWPNNHSVERVTHSYPAKLTPPTIPTSTETALDAALLKAEQEEIERLEQEPIDVS